MTELQENIKELYLTHTMGEVAKLLGCSDEYVRYTIKEFGLRHSEEGIERLIGIPRAHGDKEVSVVVKKRIIELYPYHTVTEISKITNAGRWYVNKVAAKEGLVQSDFVKEKIRRLKQESALNTHTPEIHAKIGQTLKRKRIAEEFLIKSGMKQQTKMIFPAVPRRVRYAINYLCEKYNYFRPDRTTSELCYDADTDRNPNEDHFTNKYGITFHPADE